MKIGFDNIYDQVIPMGSFSMRWRFTEPEYNVLPDIHLGQIKPLNGAGAKFLWGYISDTKLHSDIPFKQGFFSAIDKIRVYQNNEKEVKKWLYQRGLPFEKEVYLSYQPDTALIVPWKILIKYFDSFYYADDLTVIDQSLNWALLFFHEDEIYFGSNMKYESSEYDNESFLY